MPDLPCPALLSLLQFADSALPIGSLSHSFGLEALIYDGDLDEELQSGPASLTRYLEDALSESLLADGVFCREAHARAIGGLPVFELNQQISGLRLAREPREASLTMGRRFASLAAALHPVPPLLVLAKTEELHHSVAFGYTFGILAIDADSTVGAFLRQCVLNAISAAQRLLPLGQTEANRMSWNLKPAILETVERSRSVSFSKVCAFSHLPETACMRHSAMPIRLFIS